MSNRDWADLNPTHSELGTQMFPQVRVNQPRDQQTLQPDPKHPTRSHHPAIDEETTR